MSGNFSGEGFEKGVIDGEEAARHRHMFHVLNGGYIQISADLLAAMQNINTVLKAVTIFYNVIRFGGPVALCMAGAGMWLKSKGLV